MRYRASYFCYSDGLNYFQNIFSSSFSKYFLQEIWTGEGDVIALLKYFFISSQSHSASPPIVLLKSNENLQIYALRHILTISKIIHRVRTMDTFWIIKSLTNHLLSSFLSILLLWQDEMITERLTNSETELVLFHFPFISIQL